MAGTASLTVYWVLWILGRETQIVGKDLLICWCVQLDEKKMKQKDEAYFLLMLHLKLGDRLF